MSHPSPQQDYLNYANSMLAPEGTLRNARTMLMCPLSSPSPTISRIGLELGDPPCDDINVRATSEKAKRDTVECYN